ncbi:hypothetical protein KP509_22G042700 [Ceratopteris richardii]|uniref:Myb/SANT-like DNA-binding domain-containing protein n=1 Tax=Ceratopteris richardii TaxID=49495 RepID=A0A8T2S7M7_CERRI|nr:hypothetical protein KP509_22G042700 [Ceratopteris richardii]
MMACEAIDIAVAGEDLQMMAMEASATVDENGGDDSFMFANVSMGSDDRNSQPQWSRDDAHGTNGNLNDGKRLEEAKWSKVKESRERGIEMGRANSDSKWLSISQFCERKGVSRSAAQCRKRWCNLSADYKRIRDWESLRGKQSFWLMSNDVRKENKLPGCFDREVFDALNKSLGNHACSVPDVIFDSGRQCTDEGLFSDIEHPLVEENLSVSADKETGSPAIESLTSAQGNYEEKFLNEKFTIDGCEDVLEEEPDILPGRKKRKRPSVEETDEFNRELCTLLESSSRILTAHMDSQNLNFHLDRTQRKEHAENLVAVLGKLADAIGKIADKL